MNHWGYLFLEQLTIFSSPLVKETHVESLRNMLIFKNKECKGNREFFESRNFKELNRKLKFSMISDRVLQNYKKLVMNKNAILSLNLRSTIFKAEFLIQKRLRYSIIALYLFLLICML